MFEWIKKAGERFDCGLPTPECWHPHLRHLEYDGTKGFAVFEFPPGKY